MSFAASLDRGRVEYAGDNLLSLIGQWQNLVRPRHWHMIADLIRFMKQGAQLRAAPAGMTLGDFLNVNKYSPAFRDDHLLPMAGAIWSAADRSNSEFPGAHFWRFFFQPWVIGVGNGKAARMADRFGRLSAICRAAGEGLWRCHCHHGQNRTGKRA